MSFREAVAREVGEEADVVGRAREDAQAHGLVQRAVVGGLDLGQVGDGGVDRVGESREVGVAPLGSERRPFRERSAGGCTAASTSAWPPLATSASFQLSQSIGLRTSNVVSLLTRRPSM